MIIHAIRFTRTPDSKEFYLRFQRDKGNLRHLCFYYADEEELLLFEKAIKYGLSGVVPSEITATSLNIIDSDGHSWVIDRKIDQSKFYRNRKVVSREIFQSYFSSYLDLDTAMESDTIVKTLELDAEKNKLLAYAHSEQKIPEHISTLWNQSISGIKEEYSFLDGLAPDECISLIMTLTPIFNQWQSLDSDSEELRSMSNHLRNIDSSYMESLEEQIDILNKIETISKDILDPQKSPEVMKEKCEKIEREYQEACKRCSIDHVPQAKDTINWELVLKTLGRLKLYENLEKSSEQTINRVRSTIEPVLKAYGETVDSFLSADSQIIGELESCLATLTNHLAKTESPKSSTWLQKLSALIAKAPKTSETELLQITGNSVELSQLENSRMAVDYALGRLGELHANHKGNRKLASEATQTITDRHDKISLEYNRLRVSWKQLADKFDLSETCSIKSILELIQSYGQLITLWNEKEELYRDTKLYRKKLSQLEGLMQHFRKVTCSQKINDLRNPNILIAETSNVLQYAAKKRNQLSKLRKMEIQLSAHQHLQGLLSRRRRKIQKEWQSAFSHHGIAPLPIENSSLDSAFEKVAILRSLRPKVQHRNILFSDGEVFQDKALDNPITIFMWLNEAWCESLPEYLKSSSRAGLGIILTSNHKVKTTLKELGISHARNVNTQQRPQTHNPQPPGSTENQLSAKAKQAMQVFETKPDQNSLNKRTTHL